MMEVPKEVKKDDVVPRRNPIGACFNCGEKGHRKDECTQPKKKINNIQVEATDSEVEDTQSQFEVVQTNPEPEFSFFVIQADIGDDLVINAIQGESNLPQKWDPSIEVGHISDAKLLTNKPEEGRSYTLGRTCYTSVLFEEKEIKVLLDIGAFCSCTRSNFLDSVYPDWKNHLLAVPKAKFSSFNASMKPIGIITMPLVFPHSKGSLRLRTEFVVLQDALCDYLILGNDTFCMYGIYIFQSKDRFYTIGGYWKRKFQIYNINTKLPEESNSHNSVSLPEKINFKEE